ncbi:MAG: DUF5906 domain-containing protein, partial [Spirochaetales bacterium]|nr:DUF5906 domain-containing protein [Spirochaetales bacterium]
MIVRPGIYGKESRWKPWRQAEIVQDHGKDFLKEIPKYDDFYMHPDNINYQQVVSNCLNLYHESPHTPSPGDWTWTQRLLQHVFGEQYELGLRYMQILYLHPDRQTIILALVSRERETGKTSFLFWLRLIFADYVVLISSTDFLSGFNGHFATKNIIQIEETLLEKNVSVEKLKALNTAKYISINEKFVQPYSIPFFGKTVIASNNEDRFAKVDQEEVRFFVRKLGKPQFRNTNIEEDLYKEVPAFLHHLQTLTAVDWSISRSGFTAEELNNDSLKKVVDESRSGLAKELEFLISDYFLNNDFHATEFYATVKDLKEKWFAVNNRVEMHYIRYVLKNDFKMQPERLM